MTTFAVACFLVMPGCRSKPANKAEIEATEQAVQELAAELDSRRTESGAHERVGATDEFKKTDAWGTDIKISYSQSPKSDVVTVRSAGPDRVFNTEDDVVAKSQDAAAREESEESAKEKASSKSVAKNDASGTAKSSPTPAKGSSKNSSNSGSSGTSAAKSKSGTEKRESVRDSIAPRKPAPQAAPGGENVAGTSTVVGCECECACESGCRIVRRVLGRRRPTEWVVHWEVTE